MTRVSPILLQDYLDQRKGYALDVETGAVTERSLGNTATASDNTAGFGAFRTIGLLLDRQRIFVAAYADEEKWVVRIAERVFDLSESMIEVKRTSLAMFVKHLTISCCGEVRLALKYFFIDYQVWPDNGDIFSFIERTASTPGAHEGFAYIWRAKKQGRDISSKEFIKELEDWRRSREGGARG